MLPPAIWCSGRKLNMKAIVHVGKSNSDAGKFVEDNSRSILANYGQSILAEVDEQDLEKIKKGGYRIRQVDDSPEIEMSGFKINTMNPQLSLSEEGTDTNVKTGKGYYIMQLIGPMHPEWKKSLENMNVTIYQQVTHNNHYLIGVDNSSLPQMFQTGYVESIIPYYPELKINPSLVNEDIHKNIDKHILNKQGIKATAIRSENIRDGVVPEKDPKNTLKLNRYPTDEKTQLDVVLFDKEHEKQFKKDIDELGIKPVDGVENHFIIEMSLEDTERLKKLIDLPYVRRIDEFSPNRLFNEIAEGIINLSIFRNNHHLQGENQTIAIADTGLDTGDAQNILPDFKGRIKAIQAFGRKNPPNASDLNGHGTHVAGSVLGDGFSTNGLIKGMAPKSDLVFQSLEDEEGGLSTPLNLEDLYKKAMDEGAILHTNSWGASCRVFNGVMVCPMAAQYDPRAADTDSFMFKHREFLILFSAGNEGDQISPFNRFVAPPGTAKNVLTVGATKSKRSLPTGSIQLDLRNDAGNFSTINNLDLEANEVGDIAAFSSIGPVKHDRIKPDIVAPGTWILSTRSTVCVEDWITRKRGSHDKAVGYGLPNGPVFGHGNKKLPAPLNFDPTFAEKCMYSSGTSMATPIVAGACAIVRQYIRNVFGTTPSAALIKAFVINGAIDLGKPSSQQGWGRIDLENSLQPKDSMKFEDNLDNAIGTGDINTYKTTPKSGDTPMNVTLTWRDPVGDTIQNQIMLRVIHEQSGKVFASEDESNILNNVQKIVISNPENGDYLIEVEGINITRGIPELQSSLRQDYALVISNCSRMDLA
jgi:subtilisin family serine protease